MKENTNGPFHHYTKLGPSNATALGPDPLHTFINNLEEDGGLVLKIILLGVLHVAGVFARVAELQVLQ